ncbi:MAG: polyprenyl synthetase family protein [Pyrinomonadaceae bacterium]
METLNDFFAEKIPKIDGVLDSLVPVADIVPTRLHEAVRWSLFGTGKRFRPALVLAVGNAFGASDGRLLRTAAAIEMIHTYSLIHDDLPAMDDDDLRRGRVTLHRKFGEATAILAGDVLQALAFGAIAQDTGLSAELRLAVISEISAAAGTPFGMVAGQQLDLEAEGLDLDIRVIEQIHTRKTGALVRAAAGSGALIGNAGDNELTVVKNWAEKIGLLFQITDDLLDVTQTTERLGKTAGKDISARKATFPSALGVEESRRMAQVVGMESKSLLRDLDRPVELLQSITAYILERTG